MQLPPAGASSSPPGLRRPLAPRPIAKFNAKVMRARVRLRAAMQERPAAGGPARRQCLTDDRGTHRIAIFRKQRVPAGHLTIDKQFRGILLREYYLLVVFPGSSLYAARCRDVSEFQRCSHHVRFSDDALGAAPCINYATSLQMSESSKYLYFIFIHPHPHTCLSHASLIYLR